MSLTLSEADYKTITEQLFLFKSPMPVLPKPVNTDDGSMPDHLAARMASIANNPRFKDMGIGVVDFTLNWMAPRVWLHNGDDAWRIASTGKIAVLLAAVQLQDDVRKVKATGLVTDPADFDTLFATIWSKSQSSIVQAIASKGSASPRISTIFDLTKARPDFQGADITLNHSKRLELITYYDLEKDWTKLPELTFWERLWLMGGRSNNGAATSCISEIGVAYIKAVLIYYGLYDKRRGGMRLLLGCGYENVDEKIRVNNINADAPLYRKLTNFEHGDNVKDIFKGSYYSNQYGSAAGLTAYMIALMQDKFVDAGACGTIRSHLGGAPDTIPGLIFEGIGASSISYAHTKLGILGTLRCEFAYLALTNSKRFGVIALGIMPIKGHTEEEQGKYLGIEIYKALSAP